MKLDDVFLSSNAKWGSPKGLLTHLKMSINAIKQPIVAIDYSYKVTFCNIVFKNLLNSPYSEIIGSPITSLFDSSGQKPNLSKNQCQLVQKLRLNDRVYVVNWAPIRFKSQNLGAISTLNDVTAYESISSELKEIQTMSQELGAIIESSFDGIFVTDGEGRVLKINQAYERITGLLQEEVLGKKMQDLVAEGVYDESVSLSILKNKKPMSIIQNIRKTNKTIMVTGTPLLDKSGNIVRIITNVRDVSELHQLQENLKKNEALKQRYQLELQQLKSKTKSTSNIIIKSKKMKEVYKLALKLAAVDSTVLLQGDSGVGKEVLSEIIHRNSTRRQKPFIKINCATIPENLLESELFGYVAGAFTGALQQGKAGIFEVADGGTLFLDEIGEMPLALQAKLLRVLQQKEIVRIGGVHPIPVNNRIMAATNKDLLEMVEKKLFRKDLFFRINVIPVVIPSLKERREAISYFIYFFLSKYNKKHGFSRQICSEAIEAMTQYDWPGNVRELKNIIERLVVLANEEIITVDNLPSAIQNSAVLPTQHSFEGKSLKQSLDEVETLILQKALRKHHTTRKVAKALGINQSTVVRKAQRLNIHLVSDA